VYKNSLLGWADKQVIYVILEALVGLGWADKQMSLLFYAILDALV
jgi:hypothetical protein